MNINEYAENLETVNWNNLSIHIAIKVFRYLIIILCGLISFIGVLLCGLKLFQPGLQMESQKMTGEMINQPLPSTLLLLLIGLVFAAATYILEHYWHPRTPFEPAR